MRKVKIETIVKCEGEACIKAGVGQTWKQFKSGDVEKITNQLEEAGWSCSNAKDLCPKCVEAGE